MKKVKAQKPVAPAAEPVVERSAKTVVKYLRISPRKARLTINAIRHKRVDDAFRILMVLNKKAARMTEKALKTAIANAKVLGLDENRLYVSQCHADGGPTFKRFMSRSMGRADRIIKRTTHLSLVVAEKPQVSTGPLPSAAKEAKQEKPKTEKVEKGRKMKKTAAAKG